CIAEPGLASPSSAMPSLNCQTSWPTSQDPEDRASCVSPTVASMARHAANAIVMVTSVRAPTPDQRAPSGVSGAAAASGLEGKTWPLQSTCSAASGHDRVIGSCDDSTG